MTFLIMKLLTTDKTYVPASGYAAVESRVALWGLSEALLRTTLLSLSDLLARTCEYRARNFPLE